MWRNNRRKLRPIRHLLLVAALLVLGGCAMGPSHPDENAPEFTPIPPVTPPAKKPPEPEPSPDQTHSKPERPEPEPTPALCAWSKTKGVASLLAVENGKGTWQFFPGDDIVFHRAPDKAGTGAEYRAILERPLNGPCDKERLILVAPL